MDTKIQNLGILQKNRWEQAKNISKEYFISKKVIITLISNRRKDEMMDDFISIYKNSTKEKKLNFLKQLLEKDSDLQLQFLQFVQGQSLDDIAGVDIDEMRDELWGELSFIDTDEIMEDYYGHCNHYGNDEEMGDEILEKVFQPYLDKSLDYLDKGNYLDAFRSILAIYELLVIETPDIKDDNYYVFADDIENYLKDMISGCLADFNMNLASKVIASDVVTLFIQLFFERYSKYKSYHLYHFNTFFESLITQINTAQILLDMINEHKLYSQESAIIMLHLAKIIEDDELYLKVANEFYECDSEIALKLLNKYKALNQEDLFANIAKKLLLQEQNQHYALNISENINKEKYEDIYRDALKAYLSYEHSVTHYKLLREYLEPGERLLFIEKFRNSYSPQFYIKLLEIEKAYEKILSFVQSNQSDYHLVEIIGPIVDVYPDEVFEIIAHNVNRLVKERGRKSYNKASQLLKLLLKTLSKKRELQLLISTLYNHQPPLPALKDELKKAGLLNIEKR